MTDTDKSELRDIVNLRVNAKLSEQDISNLVALITQQCNQARIDELEKMLVWGTGRRTIHGRKSESYNNRIAELQAKE